MPLIITDETPEKPSVREIARAAVAKYRRKKTRQENIEKVKAQIFGK